MTNNNNNNYSWTKDFSAAVLLQEQGIAPGPPAGTTLEGAGGDSVTPAPHHCTPISSITPGTPSTASGSGGAEGEGGGRGEASLPCAWQGGRGGTGLPPLPPPTPEVRAGSQAHTDPDGCHGGGGQHLRTDGHDAQPRTDRQQHGHAALAGSPARPGQSGGFQFREGSLLWVFLLLLLCFLFIFLPAREL